jgi:hypothetical protein
MSEILLHLFPKNNKFFGLLDIFTLDSETMACLDLRAILAIMISSVYCLYLHAINNKTTFCGVNINQPEGKDRIDTAL